MRIAILHANTDDSAFARRHPSETEKFRALLAPLRPDWQFHEVMVKYGDLPARPRDYDGYIVSGSPSSVNGDEAWVAPLLDFIRAVAAAEVPIYGACFGHQTIAVALGGRVGDNPAGWEFGRVETVLRRPWDGVEQALSLYAAHSEQVVQLPPLAVATGATAGCPVAAFAIGSKVWTTQYHPEMTPDFVTDLVAEYGPKLPEAVGARARASLDKIADEPAIALAIIEFFENALA